ncbi:hypothetical protein [Micropruina sp.]|uniref:hypothetical protein n=1 Tax=Micropruina sp. TaxID=2737536 RepID=UPI0039E2BBF0
MTAIALPGGGYGVFVADTDAIDLIPGRPAPEAPGGGPSVRLFDDGRLTHVSLGACWPVPEQWLRTRLPGLGLSRRFTGRASQLRVAVAGTPTLTLAVASVPGAEPSPLITVTTSGYPPFNAILGVPAGPDAAAALRAAASGEPGRAFVSITARVPADLELDPAVLATTALTITDRTVTVTTDLADWQHTPNTN